ncbi:hypothetical protein ACFV24_02980 [Nocardia fluminea]
MATLLPPGQEVLGRDPGIGAIVTVERVHVLGQDPLWANTLRLSPPIAKG